MIAAPRPNPVAHFSLLAGLSPHELASFLSELRKVRVEAGQIVIIQNEWTNQVYFVFSGRLLGQLNSENGRGISFTQISAGNYFGELAALDDSPRSITVSAIEKSQLGVMSGRDFRRWLTLRGFLRFLWLWSATLPCAIDNSPNVSMDLSLMM
jgi:CRP-like cAMP-binding protein